MGKYARVREALERERPELLVPAPRASWEDLGLVHDAAYLEALRTGTLEEGAVRRLGFPQSDALVNRSRRSTGGTLAALSWALAHGAAGHLAGGTHHAFRDRGEGFCVFNDLAVAVAVARRDHFVRRIAIVDLDVHQGNGTAALLAGGSRGLHALPPRREELSLPQGEELARRGPAGRLRRRALPARARSGARGRRRAPARAAALPGRRRRARAAIGWAGSSSRTRGCAPATGGCSSSRRGLGVPLVVTLGGGYGRDLEATIAAHAAVYLGLAERFA